MKKKLSKEELSNFSSARNRVFDLKLHLADVAMTEEAIKKERSKTVSELEMAKTVFDNFNREIIEKYGEGVKINFTTGEIAQ
jgi:hypothetical protein